MIAKRAFATIGILCLLAGCGDKTGSAPPTPASHPVTSGRHVDPAMFKIALIMKTLGNPFFAEMEKGAQRAQHDSGVQLTIKAIDEETAVEQQISFVKEEINAHVNAIVIVPVDSRRLVPALKKAQDGGIRIVNIDNRLDAGAMKESGMSAVPFISVDNEQGAYLSAKYVSQKITEPTEVAIVEGNLHADNANARLHGAERAFAENPNLSIVARESANWTLDEAYAISKPVFSDHPKIRLVFCANDMMAFGVLKYLKESKLNDVRVASFDGLEQAKQAIRDGTLLATVDQQAAKQGYEGIMTAVKALKGEVVPPEILLDAALVTAESLHQK